MKYWLVGIVLGLLFPVSFATSAQWASVHYDEDYTRQAIADIATVEAAYNAVRLYYDGDETQADAKTGHGELVKLVKRLVAKSPPIPATGIQEQIVFAAKRCQNYAAKIGWVLPEHLENVFVVAVEAQLREYCAVQIHAAKLRLIDYGVANGVNPYGE